MAFVLNYIRRTVVEGRFNKYEFDTLKAKKKYAFELTCRNEFVDGFFRAYKDTIEFTIDMDFYYPSPIKNERMYLVIPNENFSLETFINLLCEYSDPIFKTYNK